jgi:hypothetical protein
MLTGAGNRLGNCVHHLYEIWPADSFNNVPLGASQKRIRNIFLPF